MWETKCHSKDVTNIEILAPTPKNVTNIKWQTSPCHQHICSQFYKNNWKGFSVAHWSNSNEYLLRKTKRFWPTWYSKVWQSVKILWWWRKGFKFLEGVFNCCWLGGVLYAKDLSLKWNLEGQMIRPIPEELWCDGKVNCPFGDDEDYDYCLKGRDPNLFAFNLKTHSYFRNSTLYERLYISNEMRRVVKNRNS